MSRAGTVAVLLPAAYYCLRETKRPPVDLFRRHGVPMAISTDCNPGTAPALSPLLTMNMTRAWDKLRAAAALRAACGSVVQHRR